MKQYLWTSILTIGLIAFAATGCRQEAEKPAMEKPAVTAPVAEEPAVEAPVTEEPVAEAPMTEEAPATEEAAN
jgi:hypothetical protein